jgi:hypothetical protein
MLKKMVIFALSLFVFSVQAYPQTHKAQQTSKSEEPSSPAAPIVQQHNDRPALQPEHQDQIQADVRVISAPAKDRYDKVSFGVSVFLALIGLGGVWYGRSTLKAIRGQLAEIKAAGLQTDQMLVHAGKQADAALKNAQAVINSERPWIVVEAEGYPEIAFKMTNKGKTPAQLVQYDPIPKVITPLLGETIGKPVYGKFFEEHWQILNEPMIFPGESRPAGSYSISILNNEAPELWNEIATVKKRLYIYSTIKYKGPFSDDIYTTGYCYLIWQGAKMSGDYGYNYNT